MFERYDVGTVVGGVVLGLLFIVAAGLSYGLTLHRPGLRKPHRQIAPALGADELPRNPDEQGFI